MLNNLNCFERVIVSISFIVFVSSALSRVKEFYANVKSICVMSSKINITDYYQFGFF